MPYIAPEARRLLDIQMGFINVEGLTQGEMNYIVTTLTARWTTSRGPLSYDNGSQGHAVLQDAADEWNRRVVAPYEDKKCAQNGDVYLDLV